MQTTISNLFEEENTIFNNINQIGENFAENSIVSTELIENQKKKTLLIQQQKELNLKLLNKRKYKKIKLQIDDLQFL